MFQKKILRTFLTQGLYRSTVIKYFETRIIKNYY